MAVNETQNQPAGAPQRRRNPIYNFLTSMKVGVLLLLVFTLACVLGTLVPQSQPAELYRQHYGAFFGNFFINTGLTNVFGSWWFNLLAIIIGISLFLCSWRRLHVILRAGKPQIDVGRGRIEQMKAHASFSTSFGKAEAVDRVARHLQARGYGVMQQNTPEATSFFAQKGRLADWGTFAVHISLLFIMVGAMYGNMPTIPGLWRGRSYSAYASLMAGKRYTVTAPKTPSFEIELEKSQAETDAMGMPTAYRSWVRIFENDKEVNSGLIEMNHPVYYHGVSMTMDQYLGAKAGFEITAKEPAGPVQHIPVPIIDNGDGNMSVDMESMAENMPQLQGNGWKVFSAHDVWHTILDKNGKVILDASGHPQPAKPGEDAVLALGVYAIETPGEGFKLVGFIPVGAEVDYKSVKFGIAESSGGRSGAVLSLHKDPGIPILYVGFAILTLGVMLAFYVSQRTIRVRVWEEKGRTSFVVGVRSRGGLAWAETELDWLRSTFSPGKKDNSS